MAIDFTIALVPEVTTLIAPILHTKIVQGRLGEKSYIGNDWMRQIKVPNVITGLGVQRDFPRPRVDPNWPCNADGHSRICHDRKI